MLLPTRDAAAIGNRRSLGDRVQHRSKRPRYAVSDNDDDVDDVSGIDELPDIGELMVEVGQTRAPV